eukprot:COSAG02_NODE_777_length_17301_cov_8.632310_2_plen_67_part_00
MVAKKMMPVPKSATDRSKAKRKHKDLDTMSKRDSEYNLKWATTMFYINVARAKLLERARGVFLGVM